MSKVAIALPVLALMLVAGFLVSTPVQADNLLLKRVQQESSMNLPKTGMSMGQVERQFGAPQRKLAPRGGDTAKHPIIHRWEYPGYIVYFERSHVIHTVLNTPAGNNTHPQNAH